MMYFRKIGLLLLLEFFAMRSFAVTNPNDSNWVYNVTGGGSFCSNAAPVGVGLDGSQWGYHYQFYKDGVAYGSLVSGTGGAISMYVSEAGTYTCQEANGSGTWMNGSVNAVVSPNPVMTSVSTDTICSGNSPGLSFTSTIPSTYSWVATENISTTGESTTLQSTNVLDNAIINTTTLYQTVVCTVTPTSIVGGCVGNPQTIYIVVKPLVDSRLNTSINSGGTYWEPSANSFTNCTGYTTSPQYVFVAVNGSSTELTNTAYSINWGDGTPTQNIPLPFNTFSHQYSNLGTFQIALSTSNDTLGCSLNRTYVFFNGNTPGGGLININNTSDCAPYTVTWPIDPQTFQNPPGTTYVFSVNDGSPELHCSQSNLPNEISHTFFQGSCGVLPNNAFTISFTINNACNIVSTSTSIHAALKPTASFTLSDTLVCIDNNLLATNHSTGSYFSNSNCSDFFNYVWKINDETSSPDWTKVNNGNDVMVQFHTPGTYKIKLIMTKPGSTIGRCNLDTLEKTVYVYPNPSYITQPASSNECIGGIASPLNVSYINGAGTPSYQWYSSPVNSNTAGTIISGATSSTYIPPTFASGTNYYYCVIHFNSGGCNNFTSNTASVTINPDPVITLQPQSATLCVGGILPSPLSVSYSGGVGSPSYQWFSNTVNSNVGGTLIAGANGAAYLPPLSTAIGTFYYYVKLSMSGSGCDTVVSNATPISVIPNPVITSQPIASQSLCQYAVPVNLVVVATGGLGAFVYQWYSNITNNNTGGTIISGATSSSYTPPTLTSGTKYYYCMITQSGGSGCVVTSNTAKVIVNPLPGKPSTPVANSPVCQSTQSVCYTSGSSSYQWQMFPISAGAFSANETSNMPTITWNSGFYGTARILVRGVNSCGIGSPSDSLYIMVNPIPLKPDKPTGTDTLHCSSTTSSSYFTHSLGYTSSYTWTILPSTAGSISNYGVVTWSQAYSGSAKIFVNGNSNCGTGPTSDTLYLNTQTLPGKPSVPMGTVHFCQGTFSSNYTTMGGLAASSYLWQIYPSNAGSVSGSSTSCTIAWNSNFAGNAKLIVRGVNSCGTGIYASDTLIITITPPAFTNVSITPSIASICYTDSVMLSLNGMPSSGTYTYQWYANSINNNTSGTLISGATSPNYLPSNTAVGTTYYYCMVTQVGGNGCYPSINPVSVSITGTVGNAGTISGVSSVHPGDTSIVYSISPIQNASNYIWTLPAGVTGNSTTNNISVNFGANILQGSISVRGNNACGLGNISTMVFNVDTFRTLNLHLYLEGLYNQGTHLMNAAMDGNTGLPKWGSSIADKIDVRLFHATSPFSLIANFNNISLSSAGNAIVPIPASLNGNYYVSIRNRNHLEAWSASPISFNSWIIHYDFSTSNFQAYGLDAQKQVVYGVFALYVGDVDQSTFVDLDDFLIFEPNLTNGSVGFLTSDFDGSGYVDLDDFVLFEPSITEGNSSQFPGKK